MFSHPNCTAKSMLLVIIHYHNYISLELIHKSQETEWLLDNGSSMNCTDIHYTNCKTSDFNSHPLQTHAMPPSLSFHKWHSLHLRIARTTVFLLIWTPRWCRLVVMGERGYKVHTKAVTHWSLALDIGLCYLRISKFMYVRTLDRLFNVPRSW